MSISDYLMQHHAEALPVKPHTMSRYYADSNATLIVYFSKYGQTEKIARRIAEKIGPSESMVKVLDAAAAIELPSLSGYRKIILGSPIYVGSHSKKLAQFIERFHDSLTRRPTAFFSVSASASGDKTQRQDAIRTMDKFLAKCDFQPDQKTIFAGAVNYRDYSWFTRMFMKWIVGRAGGDTDTSKNHEYTDWNEVNEFAERISGAESRSNHLPSTF